MNQPKATVKKLVSVETFFVNIEEINKQGKAEEVSYLAFFNPKSAEHKLTLARVSKLELAVAKPHITDQFLLEKLQQTAPPPSTSPFVPPPPTVKPTLPRRGNTGSTSKLKEVLQNAQLPLKETSDAVQVEPSSATDATESSASEPSAPKRGRPKKTSVVEQLDDATP